MEYTVLIQPQRNGSFEAIIPALPSCRSRGTTEEEALSKLRLSLRELLQRSKITSIELQERKPNAHDPWQEMAGMWREDPTWDEYQRLIKKNRKRPRSRK